jgi:hypothetical protein
MIIDIICAILIFADIILGGVCYSYWKVFIKGGEDD